MKKIISLLVATLLMFSAMPVAFAAEVTTMDSLAPTFGVYNTAYPGKSVGDEYVVRKNSDSKNQPSLKVTFPSNVANTNVATYYPGAKWYKVDFDYNMKVDNSFAFQFKSFFVSNKLAYIPNYCKSTGVVKKSNVSLKSGEKLHISILYNLKDNIKYFFINNLLVSFRKMTNSDIGGSVSFVMTPAPTTASLSDGETLDIFSVTNATGKLYDASTTIEDMGLYNWMYTETETSDGYLYTIEQSMPGDAMFSGDTALSNSTGAYVAGFNSEGMLLGITPFTQIPGSAINALTFTTTEKIHNIKLFIWDNEGQLTPVIPSTKPMQVETFKPATAGFATQVN